MKKTLSAFLAICMVGIISGCTGKDVGVVTENPEEVKDFSFISLMLGSSHMEKWHENNVITRVKCDKLRLSDESMEEYPLLSKAFDDYNDEGIKASKALMYDFEEEAKNLAGDMYNPAYCEAESCVYIQRADNNIVSFLEGIFIYAGGVHPDYFWHGNNINPETGEKISLSEVLKDTSVLPSLLEQKITEKYSYVTFYELSDTFGSYKEEDFTWTIDYQGINFWFSPYEIAAYSVGTLSCKIYFDEFPDMFFEEYTSSPESYVIRIPLGMDIDFDVDGDGTNDTVYAEKYPDQYGSYYMLYLAANGNGFTDEINYAYGFDVYLAHIGGKSYIYSDSVSDDDYHMFCTYDLNKDNPAKTDELYGTAFDNEYIEDGEEYGTVYTWVFNNPEKFRLETRLDILGTRSGKAAYKAGKDGGKPEMTDKAYTFDYIRDVKTLIPLEAELLPESEKINLPGGTSLTPYQTDGKSYVDLKNADGGIVRLDIDVSGWPLTVNGIPEDECFEGLLYAG